MSEKPETVYRQKLKEVRGAIKTVKKLMESEREEISLKATDLFIQLSDLELALLEVLKGEPRKPEADERNPLVRRTRIDR